MKLTQTATYWTMAGVATLMLSIGSAFAQADGATHICEELMRQEHTEAEMKTCIEEFGEPASFRQARDDQRRRADSAAQAQQERERYFDKIFTSAELRRFGAPYVAKRNYYDGYGRVYKTKELTEAKHLCKYLGFDKNLGNGSVSEVMEDFDHQSFVGVTVKDPLFGSLSADQFRFGESDDPSSIQVFTSLTCRRDRKDGDPESSVVSSTEAINREVRQSDRQDSGETARNDSSRRRESYLGENSPYLYRPEATPSASGNQR